MAPKLHLVSSASDDEIEHGRHAAHAAYGELERDLRATRKALRQAQHELLLRRVVDWSVGAALIAAGVGLTLAVQWMWGG